MRSPVRMYATGWCPYCVAARRLLETLGAQVEEFDVNTSRELRAEMEQRSGRYTVPQIWIGERHIGGFDELDALHRRGLLRPLLDHPSGAEPSIDG